MKTQRLNELYKKVEDLKSEIRDEIRKEVVTNDDQIARAISGCWITESKVCGEIQSVEIVRDSVNEPEEMTVHLKGDHDIKKHFSLKDLSDWEIADLLLVLEAIT